MTQTTLRGAEPEDADNLLELIEMASGGFVRNLFATIAPPGMAVDDFIVERMNAPESGLSFSKMCVAEVEGAIAGFIALDQTPEMPGPIDPDTPAMFRPLTELENQAPGCCLINLLATFPVYRGRGVGASLIAQAERQRGRNGLCLTVGETNTGAQAFYERIGFRNVGSRPVIKETWETPYENWILMTRP